MQTQIKTKEDLIALYPAKIPPEGKLLQRRLNMDEIAMRMEAMELGLSFDEYKEFTK